MEVPEQDQHNDNTGWYLSIVPLLDEELKVINGCQERENYFLLRRNSNIMCPMSSCQICIHVHTDNAKWTQEVIYTDMCVCLCIYTLVYKCINNTLERDCGSLNKNGTYRLIFLNAYWSGHGIIWEGLESMAFWSRYGHFGRSVSLEVGSGLWGFKSSC